MPRVHKVECVECGLMVTRERAGHRPDKGYEYVNGLGEKWEGRKCPVCVSEEYKSFDPDPMTHRLCRKCEKPLPKSKYFRHEDCWLEFGAVNTAAVDEIQGRIGRKL